MLIRQTLLYLPAQVLAPLVQFASILVWTHLLIPTDLGIVTLVIATQEVCFAVFFGWWQRYALRFIRSFSAGERRRAYLRSETMALIVSTVLQTLIVSPVMVMQFGGKMTPALLALSTVFMITRSISNYMAERARADARIALYSLIQICGPVVGFALGVPIMLHYGSTPAAVFVGFAVAQVLGLIASLFMCDVFRAAGRPDRDIVRTAITFGGAVMLASMLAILAINAPRYIVSESLGLAAVGVFSVGYSLGLRASSFAVTLVTAGAYPLVVRKMEEEGRDAAYDQLSKNMVLVALAVAPVAFGLLGVNRSVVQVLIAEPFRAASLAVLPLSTMGGLFRYLRAHTTDQVFLISLRPGFSTLIAVFDIVVAVASAFIGLRTLGLAGAALGPMISGLVTLTLSFVLSRTMFDFRAPVGAFFRIFVASAAMCFAVSLFPVARHAGMLVVAIATGGLLYAAFIAILMPSERKLLTQMLERRLRRRRPVTA